MVNCLNSVDLKVEEQADDRLEVRIPSCRAARDLQHEDDLIEEVGRLAGYHRIPAELPRLAVDPPRRDPLRLLERQVLLTLVHQGGYNEVLSYSFATDRQREAYHDSSERSLSLPNPVHAEASQLRRSLVPGILEHLARNQLHRDQIRLVEVGRSYHPEEQLDGLPQERRTLVAARLQRTPGRPQGSAHEQAVLAMRADLQALFERLKIDWEGVAAEDVAAFAHPGRCISVRCGGQEVGQLGQLHPRLAQAFEIESPTAILELRLDALVGAPREYVQMQAIPQFPAVRRDLSVEAPEETTIAAVLKEIRAGGGARLTRAELFDVYQGKNITEGHRSLAFRLEYRAEDRTLTDEEADQAHQRVVQRLDRLGIRQRA
jgi:phenylalanyl-tRNA synthetase beta chain